LARLLDSGRELNLDIAGPGEIIGEGGVFGESCRHGLAQTLAPTLVARVPSAWLASAAEGDAGIALELTQIILERRLRMESRTVQNLSWGCGQRVGALLLELAERFGSLTPSGRNLGVRLTHEDVARFIGAARETVTPLLVSLRSEGVISYDRRNLIIRDPGRLREKGTRPTPA